MKQTLLDKISKNSHNTILTDKWKNGKVGEIVDVIGDGVYRFVDYLIDKSGEIRKRCLSEEDEMACPIVASGIVAYWFRQRDNMGTKKIFDSYYNMKMASYEKTHECDEDAWNRDLKREFACHSHISTEKKRSKYRKQYLII